MFPAKIYVGQITVVFGIVIASTWGATQWTAAALGFQGRLGAPWFAVSGYPVYLPWLPRGEQDGSGASTMMRGLRRARDAGRA
ncbi:hypothetical protein M2192_002834 [Bradyrhizobium elkanii USDA 61]|nr:hypothetical protein [Bradyrhizobium elkanii]MCS3721458.1 hypothetical protein [Bradyrhizobium elkanii]MCS4005874.1 hypothetical protein [Bradyrhizobium elkanii USDA 61]